ncbi:MAG: hypothetical protein ACP5GL_07395 [Infirmifilum sp.]
MRESLVSISERMLKNFKNGALVPKDKETYDALVERLQHVKMDHNSKVRFAEESLKYITNNNILEINEDNIDRIISEIADFNTNLLTEDLLDWLNSDPHNLYYLTVALGYSPEDGPRLLTLAWFEARKDVARAVIGALQDLLKEKPLV